MEVFNIFCDASIDTKEKVACSGLILTNALANEIISIEHFIQTNATNNSSEILAILSSIRLAIRFKNILNINCIFNIFSDSKLCIFGLRDWLGKWYANQKIEDGISVLYGSSKDPVKNQEYFKECIRLIVDNNLRLNLFHNRGHIAYKVPDKLLYARNTFIEYNGIEPESIGLSMYTICKYNDFVDVSTKSLLSQMKNSSQTNYSYKYEENKPDGNFLLDDSYYNKYNDLVNCKF